MKLYCDALEHHDGKRVLATHIGSESDSLFLMCSECTNFYRDEDPIDPIIEVPVEVQVGGTSAGRKYWAEVVPGDVVVLPQVDDVFADPNLAQVDRVEKLSDWQVRVTLYSGDGAELDEERSEFGATTVEVVGHENGYGTEREAL